MSSNSYANLLGPVPPNDFYGDGCTWAPDSWGGAYFFEACRRHDWWYRTRCLSRWQADWRFLRNLRKLQCPTLLALAYWLAVRAIGRYCYGRGSCSDPY